MNLSTRNEKISGKKEAKLNGLEFLTLPVKDCILTIGRRGIQYFMNNFRYFCSCLFNKVSRAVKIDVWCEKSTNMIDKYAFNS